MVVWRTGKNAKVTGKINKDADNACCSTGLSFGYGKTALKSVLFTENITSIGYNVFQGSDNLTDVTIQNPIEEIGMGAFMNCKNLESVTLPNSVKKIDYLAFGDCRKLESLTIPNSIEQIGSEVFKFGGIDSEKLSIKVRVSKNENIKNEMKDMVDLRLKAKIKCIETIVT